MEFGILGPVSVRARGAEMRLDGEKQRTVLAALLIAEGSFFPDAELSWFLWGDRPPATHTAQIYNYVSRLRRTLGPEVGIIRRPHGYLMRIGAASFDLLRFRDLAGQGQSAILAGKYEEAGDLLRDALTLWRGPVLANVSEHLAGSEGPPLEEARISVLAGRVEADLAVGRHPQVLPELTRLVAQYPLHERFRAQLMTALYRCDRQAEALALYDHGRRLLGDELGVAPGPLLREIHRAILASDPCLHRPLDQWH
ncbi:AfsR/SARP family transcriptional regulator [Streptomyces sporangiiformans]|uniref:AfsR/SARP family transcriptional regulator n=1 Tax=Streptomyces sporangiiformans TaxID=2315329 RepID=A0A505DMY5_9ACTN|nr:AfsR/SARP family transcriptional regulator [Streptomyces sporangiiformans]TPQ22179.1 AfsR/SARP family transcriptional regulator [Streptomyces sporangiiformans]